MDNTPKNPAYRVTLLLSDNLLATSATLPVEILHTAAGAAHGYDRRARSVAIQSVSLDGKPVASSSGFALAPTTALADADASDLIHIPGQWRNPRLALHKYADYLPWLRAQHEKGTMITAVGTGSCFLAAAGLLDNRAATTHWHYFDQFQRDYPHVLLKRQYFITRADNLYCAASVNSLAELMVNVIYRWYGGAVANLVQRNFFHEIRDSFEPSHYFTEDVEQHPDEDILQAQIWLQDHFQKPVSIAALAQQFGMSVRTFNRRFKGALGRSPLDYLQSLRLNSIKNLLQYTNLTLGEIAHRCGYQDVAHLTHLFRRHFHTTPGQYRGTVRAKLFSADPKVMGN
ncbi:MAG: GlxA family transcriptional regulator [Porticoccaceae bacterium]